MRRVTVVVLTCLLAKATSAQEPRWTYSPLPGEGDRAAMGCSSESTTEAFGCLAVRCEDDFTTGVYVHTSRSEGDVGLWEITIDKDTRSFQAMPTSTGYGARLPDEEGWLLDGIKAGAVAYLQPSGGSSFGASNISLEGSHYAINHALAYCAPRLPASH